MEISELERHIAMNAPFYVGWDKQRFLEDGEIIEFSSCMRTYNNAEFTINDDVSRKIWYSQLAQPGLRKDFKTVAFAGIQFLDGSVFVIEKMSVDEFVAKVRDKRFKVEEYGNISYTINKQSKTLKNKAIQSIRDAIIFAFECVQSEKYEDLGDSIKPSNLYNLFEV